MVEVMLTNIEQPFYEFARATITMNTKAFMYGKLCSLKS